MGLSRTKIIDNDEHVANVDEIVNALQTIDVFHYEIHEGNAYSLSQFFVALANSATATMMVSTIGGCHPHFELGVISEGNAYVLLQASPTIKHSGTTMTPVNRDRTSSNASKLVGHYSVSGVTSYAGTTLWKGIIPGGVKNTAVGGTSTQRQEWILNSGTTYIIAVRNIAGSAKNVSVDANWYEE